MITKDINESVLENPVALAMAVLANRIHNLPKEDKDDLFELTKAFFEAGSKEESESAARGMREILEQAPSTIRRVEPVDGPGDELRNWVDWTSAKIKSLRKAAGLTQDELGKKAGLPQSHICRLENGEHSPSFTTLEKIARALGVAVSVLDPSAPESPAA